MDERADDDFTIPWADPPEDKPGEASVPDVRIAWGDDEEQAIQRARGSGDRPAPPELPAVAGNGDTSDDVDGVGDPGDESEPEVEPPAIEWAAASPPHEPARSVPDMIRSRDEWEAWRDSFTGRLDRAASTLREFAKWAEVRGLDRLDTSPLDEAADQLEGRVRRLQDQGSDAGT